MVVHLAPASALAAAGASRPQAGLGAFPDQVALKLVQSSAQVEGEPPGSSGGVQVFLQRGELQVPRRQPVDLADQVLQTATEPIRLPDD